MQLAGGKGTEDELQGTGLTFAELEHLRSRLEQEAQSYILPFLQETVVKGGLHVASPHYKELVFNLGSPAPACQLLPANVFAAVDDVLQTGTVMWDLATDTHVKTWAPRLHHLLHTTIPQESDGKLPPYALQLLGVLRHTADVSFKPHGENVDVMPCQPTPTNHQTHHTPHTLL